MTIRHSRNADSNFYWCTNPSYDDGNVHHNQNLPMACPKCGHHTCVRHLVPWHFGKTCEAYDNDPKRQQQKEKRNAERIANNTLLQKISKKCPSCGANLEKTDGDMEDALILQQLHDSRAAIVPREGWRRWEPQEVTVAEAARIPAAEAAWRAEIERARNLHARSGNQTDRPLPRSEAGLRHWRHERLQNLRIGTVRPVSAPSAEVEGQVPSLFDRATRQRLDAEWDNLLRVRREVDEDLARARRDRMFLVQHQPPSYRTSTLAGDRSPFGSSTDADLAPPLSYRDQAGFTTTSPPIAGLAGGLHLETRNAPPNMRTPRNMTENDHPRSFIPGPNTHRAIRPLPNIGALTIADLEA
ncbi:hypothetical protein LTR86_005892 [Recurvomyces mirabilis]|nr:hypothetical protein LTR86_005892 [Recurvomyces mirabilis]